MTGWVFPVRLFHSRLSAGLRVCQGPVGHVIADGRQRLVSPALRLEGGVRKAQRRQGFIGDHGEAEPVARRDRGYLADVDQPNGRLPSFRAAVAELTDPVHTPGPDGP